MRSRREVLQFLTTSALSVTVAKSLAHGDDVRSQWPSSEELNGTRPGSDIATLWRGAQRRAARNVVRILWDRGGNSGASGIIVGGKWLLTCRHNAEAASRLSDIVIVSRFEREFEASRRGYFVCAPDEGYFESKDPLLDFLLVRIKLLHCATGTVSSAETFAVTPCAVIPDGDVAVDIVMVGHPETGINCSSISRDWASKTFKPALCRKASRYGEVELSVETCRGHSGAALFDSLGRLLGLHISGQSNPSRLRAVTVEAIRSQLLDRGGPYIDGLTTSLPTTTASPVSWPQTRVVDEVVTGTPTQPSSELYVPDFGLGRLGALCYIFWTDYLSGNISFNSCATGFLIGDDWVLTARHVLPSPYSASRATAVFGFGPALGSFGVPDPQVTDRSTLRRLVDQGLTRSFSRTEFFSSFDGFSSYTGRERSLDYTLVRLAPSSSGTQAARACLKATFARPSPLSECHIGQHRPAVPTGYWRPAGGVGRIRGCDETRLFYDAGCASSGASGAPIFDASGDVIGIHTNSPNEPLPSYTRYWERTRLQQTDVCAFGTRVTAIARDLVMTHRFDLSRLPGLQNAWQSSPTLHGLGAG